MSNTFLISDHHFSHPSVCKFLRDDGSKLRPWNEDQVEEMDEFMIESWNSVVGAKDKVYYLGDFCIKRKDIQILSRLKGDKVLVRGNHDIFKMEDYTPFFRDIRGTHKLDNCILSHYPIHPDSIARWALCNIHGHTHYRNVLDADGNEDIHYFNVSVENINYVPIAFEEIKRQVGTRQQERTRDALAVFVPKTALGKKLSAIKKIMPDN